MSELKKKEPSEGFTEIAIRILRYDPNRYDDIYWQTYKAPLQIRERISILSLLQSIFENQDSSLAFIGPCEKGLCGMCTVIVNGEARLACNTYVNDDVSIEPLRGFEIIRDLIVDRNKPM